ncbi:MAG TPA: hypothetical protein VGK74_03045 [Symbiobacteriaceae bacterium]
MKRYQSQPVVVKQQAKVRSARTSLWRKLRQQVRATWRWFIVRTVRHWFNRADNRVPDPALSATLGDVRQFPGSRWQ